MKILLSLTLLLNTLFAQTILSVKIDDFTSEKSWWEYHRDGTVKNDPDAIINGKGYLKIRLLKPQDNMECNVGISEPQPIYPKKIKILTTEIRIKLLTDMKQGSRGWGFWKTAKMGRADNVAWFMEQYLAGKPKFSWSRFGTIHKRKIDLKDIQIKKNVWHTYKIVRDLNAKQTDYFIDGQLSHTSRGIAPTGRMAFHLWIDNQVYSRSKGIQRMAWQGISEMVVDYVSIYSGYSPSKSFPVDGGIKLFEKPLLFGSGEKGEELLNETVPLSPGKTVVLMSVVAEKYAAFDNPDKLILKATDENGKVYAKTQWDGQKKNPLNKVLIFDTESEQIELKTVGDNTPFISDLVVFNSPTGKVLINDDVNAKPIADGLWKTYSFTSDGSPVDFYLSGVAMESPGWNHIKKSSHNEKTDDDLKIEIDGQDFGWNSEYSFDGNRQFGLADVIVLRQRLAAGRHTLKVFVENKPLLNRVFIFQE
jgi:hypothetical protein